jgi:hypothetical protein
VDNKRCLYQTDFFLTMARNQFFQIHCVICFNDNTTSNERRSTDKLTPIRNVFESIISTFQITYPSNEHIDFDEQLVMLRGTRPFHEFIKSNVESMGSN